jgi:hypothetical protein
VQQEIQLHRNLKHHNVVQFIQENVEQYCLAIGAYILENTPPPPGGEISADVIWGKKYEKVKKKREKM